MIILFKNDNFFILLLSSMIANFAIRCTYRDVKEKRDEANCMK